MPRFDLLSMSNMKTLKGEAFGYMTAILHLAPSWLSGFNTCPSASAGCIAGCLNKAGHGGMFKAGATTNYVQEARIRRTKMFFSAREFFMATLVADVVRFLAACTKAQLAPALRLNGTSDIRWEYVECVRDGVTYPNMMTAFPEITFYDYTKIPNRRDLPSNYSLTFSLNEENEIAARSHLDNGGNVAIVFAGTLPATFWGYDVINGDVSDLRFNDRRNVIVGLTAKGPAKKDVSGFVKRVA